MPENPNLPPEPPQPPEGPKADRGAKYQKQRPESAPPPAEDSSSAVVGGTPPKPAPPKPSDSVIDLGAAEPDEGGSGSMHAPIAEVPAPGSGQSLISWAEVIRQQQESPPPAGEAPPAITVDSVSDKDLLSRIAEEEQAKTQPMPRSEMPQPPAAAEGPPSDSAIFGRGSASDLPPTPMTPVEPLEEATPSASESGSGSAVLFGPGAEEPFSLSWPPPADSAEVIEAGPVPDSGEVLSAEPISGDDVVPMAEVIEGPASGTHLAEGEVLMAEEVAGDSGILGGEAILAEPASSDSMPPSPVAGAGREDSALEILIGGEGMSDPDHDPGVSGAIDYSEPELFMPGASKVGGELTEHADESGELPAFAEEVPEGEVVDVSPPEGAERGEGISAVDILAGTSMETAITPSGSLEISEEDRRADEARTREHESSSIDLGSDPSQSEFSVPAMHPGSHDSFALPDLPDLDETVEAEAEVHFHDDEPDFAAAAYPVAGAEADEDDGGVVDMSLPPRAEGDPGASSIIKPTDFEAEVAAMMAADDEGSSEHGFEADATTADEDSAARALAEDEDEAPPPRRRGRRTDTAEPVAEVSAPAEEEDLVIEHAAEEEEAPPAEEAPRRGRRGRAAAAATDEAEVPTPPKPPKRGGMLVGGLVGLLVGAGAFAGAWFGGVLPSDPNSLFSDQPTQPGAQQPNPPPPAGPQATPELARQFMAAGEPAKALETYGKLDASQPAVQAGRGQARWLSYVKAQAQKNGKLDPKAPEVTQARADLEAAAKGDGPDAARAQLWLGVMDETLGNLDAAAKAYQAGRQRFPKSEAIFAAAENRLEAMRGPTPGGNVGAAEALRNLVLLTVLLQAAPPGKDQPADAADEEAGFRFWEATVWAQRNDYPKARKALAQAKAIHDKRRKELAGKGLNPLSDPMEQIFLKSCDELDQLWAMREALYGVPDAAKVAQAKGFPAALADLVDRRKQADAMLAAVAKRLEPEKIDAQDLPKAIDALLKMRDTAAADKKAADEVLAKIGKDVKDAGIDEPKIEAGVAKLAAARKLADEQLKAIAKELDGANVPAADPVKGVGQLAKERAAANDLVQGVVQRLKAANFLPKGDRAEVLSGLESMIARAQAPGVDALTPPAVAVVVGSAPATAHTINVTGQLVAARNQIQKTQTTLQTEIARFEKLLTQVRTPAQSLDLWLTILADRGRRADAGPALVDARRVLDDPKSSPERKAKALAVRGLALRNQGDYAGAREAFAEARKSPGFARDEPWAQSVAAAADALQDPASVLNVAAPAAPPKTVLETIDAGLKMFPAETYAKEHGKLLARRSLVKLEQNDVAGATADAEAAIKSGAKADGRYASARIAEKAGKLRVAEELYRQVIKAEPPESLLHREAQMGLARVLLQRVRRTPGNGPVTPKEPAPEARPISRNLDGLRPSLLLAALVLLQPPPAFADPDEARRIDEAIKLADELIANKQYVGHLIKADALAKKGMYNDALAEYSLGLKRLNVLPAEYAGVLDRILAVHPAMQRPDGIRPPNPALGEKLYSDGVNAFFAGDYAKSEQLLLQAIRQNNEDARYLYFLGLARWFQGKKEFAAADFKVAADLEKHGKPPTRVIDLSLERIQGPAREMLNGYRP